MNGLQPHFFAGGVPLSRADFPGNGLRDWIAFTLAFSANVHFGDKDAALELFYSEADSIYERCEQEILSRLAKSSKEEPQTVNQKMLFIPKEEAPDIGSSEA